MTTLIENRVHTFEPDRRGQDFYCRECSLPASAEIHNDAAQNSQLLDQGSKRQTVSASHPRCIAHPGSRTVYCMKCRRYICRQCLTGHEVYYCQSCREVHTKGFEPTTCRHRQAFPVEGKQFKSLTEAQTVCSGYGSPDNGFTCGREKDFDAQWCDNCQESADLDEREGENDPSLIYPQLLN